MKFPFALSAPLIAGSVLSATADPNLFQATPLTEPGSFTKGVEGPACDADGNVYAVNFGRQQTIGPIMPDERAELFLTLPGRSVGNGVCFGGPDGRTAYVTEATEQRLVQFRVGHTGAAWRR